MNPDRPNSDADRFNDASITRLREANRLAADIRRAPSSQQTELFTKLAKLTRVEECSTGEAQREEPSSEKRSAMRLDEDVAKVLLATIDEHRLIDGVLRSKAWSHSPEDQEDLGQEIRIKLVSYLAKWRGETSLVGLLRTMAGSLSHDAARKSEIRPHDLYASPPEPTAPARRLSSTVADQERTRVLLLKIAPRYSEPFRLHRLEGHTIAETARLLDKTEGSIRRNIKTAETYLGRLW